jgi:hypothetical protein
MQTTLSEALCIAFRTAVTAGNVCGFTICVRYERVGALDLVFAGYFLYASVRSGRQLVELLTKPLDTPAQ